MKNLPFELVVVDFVNWCIVSDQISLFQITNLRLFINDFVKQSAFWTGDEEEEHELNLLDFEAIWSGRRGSNPRQPAWKASYQFPQ